MNLSDQRIFAHVRRNTGPDGWFPVQHWTTVVEDLHTSRSVVYAALLRLTREGYLERERQRRHGILVWCYRAVREAPERTHWAGKDGGITQANREDAT